jgi:GNAT superfamily N-acetyltransferase
MTPPANTRNLDIHPLTPERWNDLQKLFGKGGGYGGCWCMWFRLRRKDFNANRAPDNKAALKAIVKSGPPPGLIAYVDGEPAGWVSLDARTRYDMLEHARIYKRIDDKPVWSIVCFVVGRDYRRQGMMSRLLGGAIDYARQQGATTIEAYPVDPSEELKTYQGYQGIRSVFEKAGFREVARLSNGRPVMRMEVHSG